MTENQLHFLSLVRLGIGNEMLKPGVSGNNQADWAAVMELASNQGLSAIALDGIELLKEGARPPRALLLQWIGNAMQSYETRFELYCHAIADLAGFYNKHGFKMMVLKGYACSLYWPKPDHRPAGDIDIWLFGDYRMAEDVLERETGIRVDKSEHHHTVFSWEGFMVENHYDFINVHHHRFNSKLETILKELGKEDSRYVELQGQKVYLPSPNLHALFLIKHATAHFAAAEITIRHLLDWAFFAKVQGNEVDWKWLEGVLANFGMKEIFHIINAICVDDLGFEKDIFPPGEVDADLKDKVLAEILNPVFSKKQPSSLLSRVFWKFRRWRSNAWKHRLCYRETLWSAFWTGVWSHLLKPKSI